LQTFISDFEAKQSNCATDHELKRLCIKASWIRKSHAVAHLTIEYMLLFM